jgi:hypothetical protein
VRLRDLGEVAEALDQREARAQVHVQRLPDAEQHPVGARLDDQTVEGDVVADEAAQVAVHRGRAHGVDLRTQRRRGAGQPLGRELGGELLEYGAHRVALGDLVGAHRPHAGAAKGLGLDQPQDPELAQRLAHRRLADAELLGYAQLDDALARLVVALDDALHEHVLDLVPQDGAAHLHGGRSCRRGVMATAGLRTNTGATLSIMYASRDRRATGGDLMLTRSTVRSAACG